MKEEIKELVEKTEQIKDYRKIISKINKEVRALNEKIKEWMETNNKDSISYDGNEIKLVEKHISQSFKKDVISEKLMEELNAPSEKCQELAESIVNNKKFIVKKIIKVKESS